MLFFRSLVMTGIFGGLLMPLFLIPDVIFPFIFSKMIVFQMVIGLTFPAYIILAWAKPQYRPPAHPLLFALMIYLVAIGISVIFAADPYLAWWGNQERMDGYFSLLHFFAWFIMIVGTIKEKKAWTALLCFQMAVSAVVALTAIGQKLQVLSFTLYLNDLNGGRTGGILNNALFLAVYLLLSLYLILILFFQTQSKATRIICFIVAAIDFIAFFFTESRGPLFGAIAGLLVFTATHYFHGKLIPRMAAKIAAICSFAAGAILAIFWWAGFLPQLKNFHWLDFYSGLSVRSYIWKIAWNAFVDRPITGWGISNFHILFNSSYDPGILRFDWAETWVDHAHNIFLDTLSTTGLLGFAAFIGVFSTLFYSVFIAYRRKTVNLPIAATLFALATAYLVQGLTCFDHTTSLLLLYFMFALTVVITQKHVPERLAANDSNQLSTIYFVRLIGLEFLFAMITIQTSFLPLRVSQLTSLVREQMGTNIALDNARFASSVWTPYLRDQIMFPFDYIDAQIRGHHQSEQAKWIDWYNELDIILRNEIRRHPQDPHVQFLYAQVLHAKALLGAINPEIAEKQYLAVIKTSPKRQAFHYGLARLYMDTGREDDAIEIFKKMRDLDPEVGITRWDYGIQLVNRKNRYLGLQELVASQNVKYPFVPTDRARIYMLADAYASLNDKKGLRSLNLRISNMGSLPLNHYKAFAEIYASLGMTKERDAIFKAAIENYTAQQKALIKQAQKDRIVFAISPRKSS